MVFGHSIYILRLPLLIPNRFLDKTTFFFTLLSIAVLSTLEHADITSMSDIVTATMHKSTIIT